MNPIIAILRNEREGTFHPIVFAESPLPGPPDEKKPVRYKSKVHHTTGFATREEAVENATKVLAPEVGDDVRFALVDDVVWDGERVPAVVAFFISLPAKDRAGTELRLSIWQFV